jgi:hypothetical protein
MIIAALIAFGALLAAWLLVPAESTRRTAVSPQPQQLPELAAEAA